MSINKKHPHADLLRAIADGKTLQLCRLDSSGFAGKYYDQHPEEVFEMLSTDSSKLMYVRVKPDPPANIVTLMFVEPVPKLDNAFNQPNLKLTFDSETKALKKAEILRGT